MKKLAVLRHGWIFVSSVDSLDSRLYAVLLSQIPNHGNILFVNVSKVELCDENIVRFGGSKEFLFLFCSIETKCRTTQVYGLKWPNFQKYLRTQLHSLNVEKMGRGSNQGWEEYIAFVTCSVINIRLDFPWCLDL